MCGLVFYQSSHGCHDISTKNLCQELPFLGVLGNTTPTQETRPGPTQTNANASVTNGYQGGAPPPSTGGTMRLPHSRTGGNSRSNNGTSNIKDILNKSMKRSEIKTLVMQEIEKNNNKETVEDLVNIVCDKSIKDPDFASLGAELFNQVWVSEEQRKLIQTPLLSSVQKKYSTRKELKRDHFYGFVVLLCELFKLLRVKGLPLRPLTTSVCEVLKELIADENPTEDDLFYFFQEMESIGETIETVSVVRYRKLMCMCQSGHSPQISKKISSLVNNNIRQM